MYCRMNDMHECGFVLRDNCFSRCASTGNLQNDLDPTIESLVGLTFAVISDWFVNLCYTISGKSPNSLKTTTNRQIHDPTSNHQAASMDAAGKVPVKLVKVTRVLGRTGTRATKIEEGRL